MNVQAALDDYNEQVQIRLAITRAIPVGAHYDNILIALAQVLTDFCRRAVRHPRDTHKAKPEEPA